MHPFKRALAVATLVALVLFTVFFAGGFVDQVIQSDRSFLAGIRQSFALAVLVMIVPGLACVLVSGMAVLVLVGVVRLDPDTAGYVIALGLSVGSLVGIYTIGFAPLVGAAMWIYPLAAAALTVLADRTYSWCQHRSAKDHSPSPTWERT